MAIRFIVRELGGSTPIRLELRGGLLPEIGALFPSEQRGDTFTPYGSAEGFSTVTGLTYGTTEMTCSWDAAFMRSDDLVVENAERNLSPEGLLRVFRLLQRRGRECLVQVGEFTRRGVLAKAEPKPGRGYFVDPSTGALGPGGFNLEVVLSWRWSGEAEALAPPDPPPVAGAEVFRMLSLADAGYGLALADMGGAFDPDAITAISGAIGRVRGQISKLRQTVRQLGSLASAPARLANEAMAAARGLGNALNDLEEQLGDTRDAYLALGKAAEDTRRALGPRPSGLAKATQAKGSIRGANQQAMEACIAVFDAIAKRKRRQATVRPGQSLADVARSELGSADRWPEIAELNDLAGQVVPPGRTAVDLPEGA